jgi:fructose-bisphosphate aldolase class II
MLTTMRDVLDLGRAGHFGVACINTPNLDLARAVIRAAEQVGSPVIVDHAEVHDAVVPVESFGSYLVEMARRASVPVAVHVDHGLTEPFIDRCLRTGFTSAMYDLSTLPYEENLARTARFAARLHAIGVSVEGELGVMGSSAQDSHGGAVTDDPRAGFTDPSTAATFATATGVDALAVCFGTVHGAYLTEPNVDLDHLRELRAAVPASTHLVMHGSSGLPLELLGEAVDAGVTKVNYYTDLAVGSAQAAARTVADTPTVQYHVLAEAVVDYATQHVRDVILALHRG